MKYYIKRDLNEYGPYTLADLQRYVAQGNISPSDLTRSEGMTEWVPVSQVLGSIPVAPPPPQAVAGAAAAPAYSPAPSQPGVMPSAVMQPGLGQQGIVYAPVQAVPGPMPPDFHWALVLVIGLFCSIFQVVWLFIEAGFVKKIRPQSNSLAFLIAGVAVEVGSVIIFYVGIFAAAATANSANSNEPPVGVFVAMGVASVILLAGGVLHIVGLFKMRSALLQYYNTVEPINLRLSGVMTFFFNVLYFQYHFSRIAQWKKTGILQPQG